MRGLEIKANRDQRLGAGFRPGARLALTLTCVRLALGILPGCVVTDPIEFETNPASPTVLTGLAPDDFGEIIWADKNANPDFTFRARVRDEDVGQELKVHWRLVTSTDKVPVFAVIELPEGSLTREFPMFVPAGQLRESECHKLEVAVSAHFGNEDQPVFFGRAPDPFKEDVARGTWWLWEGDGELIALDQAKQIVESCQALKFEAAATGVAGQGEP